MPYTFLWGSVVSLRGNLIREKMKPFFPYSALPFLLLFFFLFSSCCLASSPPVTMASAPVPSSAHRNTVRKACHMAWQHKPQYKTCVAALRSSRSSRNATLVDLGILSTALAVRDASTALQRMQELHSGDAGGLTNWETLALAECMKDYRKSISTMEGCMQEIREGHYGAAGYSLDSALHAAGCGRNVVGMGAEYVGEKTEKIGVLVRVAKAICYKYCRQSDVHEPDCLF